MKKPAKKPAKKTATDTIRLRGEEAVFPYLQMVSVNYCRQFLPQRWERNSEDEKYAWLERNVNLRTHGRNFNKEDSVRLLEKMRKEAMAIRHLEYSAKEDRAKAHRMRVRVGKIHKEAQEVKSSSLAQIAELEEQHILELNRLCKASTEIENRLLAKVHRLLDKITEMENEK